MEDFDHIYYANKYSDLKTTFGFNEYKLRRHWLDFGKNENRFKNRMEELDFVKKATSKLNETKAAEMKAEPVLNNKILGDNKVIVFVQSHDLISFKTANEKFKQFPWAYPVLVKNANVNNVLMENKFFVEFQDNVDERVYKDFEFIGFMSYSAQSKININEANKIITNYDKGNFYHFAANGCILSASKYVKSHPNFLEIWDDVFAKILGSTNEAIDNNYNYFIIKKEIFFEYQKFLKEIIPCLLEHPLALTDAKYVTGLNKVKKLNLLTNNLGFYPHVPFVLERVIVNWVKYFNQSNLSKIWKVFIFSVNIGKYDDDKEHVLQNTRHSITFKTFRSNELNFEGRHTYEICHRYRMGTHFMNLEDYDIAIYLDANVQIIKSDFVDSIVNSCLEEKWDFLMSKHEQRSNGLQELIECTNSSKFSNAGLLYHKNLIGHDRSQLCWCGFNAQWLQSPNRQTVVNCLDKWWFYLKEDPTGVCNDQIIFPFVKSQFNFNMKYICPQYLQNDLFSIVINNNHGLNYVNYIKKVFNTRQYCKTYGLDFEDKKEAFTFFIENGLDLGHKLVTTKKSVAVIVLNYKRPKNIIEQILPQLLQCDIVTTIVIAHGDKECCFGLDLKEDGEIVRDGKVLHVGDFEANNNYKCWRRWLLIHKLFNMNLLKEEYVHSQDDDILFENDIILNLVQKYEDTTYPLISAVEGRNIKNFKYNFDCVAGNCDIVIGRSIFTTIETICEAVNKSYNIPPNILATSDDITISFLTQKKCHFAMCAKYTNLDDSFALSKLPTHLETRNKGVQYFLTKFKVAVYSCNFGNYRNEIRNGIDAINFCDNVNYYFYTDNEVITSEKWKIIYTPLIESKDQNIITSERLTSKNIKFVTPKELKNYDIVIWCDSKCLQNLNFITFELNNWFYQSAYNMICLKHPIRNTLQEEILFTLVIEYENKVQGRKYYDEIKRCLISSKLIDTCFIVRKNNATINAFQKVYDLMCEKELKRDQNVFNYAMELEKIFEDQIFLFKKIEELNNLL